MEEVSMHLVNSEYARAARETQRALKTYLIRIFTPMFGKDTAVRIDEIAAYMSRNISVSERSYAGMTPAQAARAYKKQREK